MYNCNHNIHKKEGINLKKVLSVVSAISLILALAFTGTVSVSANDTEVIYDYAFNAFAHNLSSGVQSESDGLNALAPTGKAHVFRVNVSTPTYLGLYGYRAIIKSEGYPVWDGTSANTKYFLPVGKYNLVAYRQTTSGEATITCRTKSGTNYSYSDNANGAYNAGTNEITLNSINASSRNAALDIVGQQRTLEAFELGEVTIAAEHDVPVLKFTNTGTSTFAIQTVIAVPVVDDPLAVEASMSEGASMRLNAQNGIRFYTTVDKEKIAALKADGATVEMGTIIAPAWLTAGELKFADETDIYAENDNYAVVPYTAENYYADDTGFEGVVGSVVNIKADNVPKEFVGRGYVKVTKGDKTTISYADYYGDDVANNTRSIRYIAQQLQADTDSYNALSDDKKAIVDGYAQ